MKISVIIPVYNTGNYLKSCLDSVLGQSFTDFEALLVDDGSKDDSGVICKVIFENCYLTDEEKRTAAEISLKVLPDFIKTSTGFGTGGATVEDVRLMKSVVGDAVKVKAAGGIRDFETAAAMIEAGAERLGTSAGVELMKHFE